MTRKVSLRYAAWALPYSQRQATIEGMQEAITRDPDVMHGTPVFSGTRVPVKNLFDYLENGESLDDFLERFPSVRRELAIQVLEESKELRLATV